MFCIIFMIVFRQLLLIFFGVKVTLLLGLKVQLSQKLIIMIFHSFHQPRYTMCHIQICMVIFVEFQLFEVVEVSFMTFLQLLASFHLSFMSLRILIAPFLIHLDLVFNPNPKCLHSIQHNYRFLQATLLFQLLEFSSQIRLVKLLIKILYLCLNMHNFHVYYTFPMQQLVNHLFHFRTHLSSRKEFVRRKTCHL